MVKRSEILPEIRRKALSKLNPDHEQTQTSTLSAKSGKKEQFLQLKPTKMKKLGKLISTNNYNETLEPKSLKPLPMMMRSFESLPMLKCSSLWRPLSREKTREKFVKFFRQKIWGKRVSACEIFWEKIWARVLRGILVPLIFSMASLLISINLG